jgi:hypothetical protein
MSKTPTTLISLLGQEAFSFLHPHLRRIIRSGINDILDDCAGNADGEHNPARGFVTMKSAESLTYGHGTQTDPLARVAAHREHIDTSLNHPPHLVGCIKAPRRYRIDGAKAIGPSNADRIPRSWSGWFPVRANAGHQFSTSER